MRASTRLHPDDRLVRTLNRVFYDVEAEQYDERHPEVVEGDAAWWSDRGAALIAGLKSGLASERGLRILDLGCGTGFVSNLFSRCLVEGDMVIGVDHSEGMLERARSKVPGAVAHFARGDAGYLQFRTHAFDLVAVNSFLHHVFDYRSVLREIDRVLRPGGYLVLAHEPNREFFRPRGHRIAASLWKLVGFRMSVPAELCERINARLRAAKLAPADLGADEILRYVEYHSPIEQRPFGIDPSKGFSPQELLAGELTDYAVAELDAYSTFSHRPLLERHPRLQRLARAAARLVAGEGNLFRAVLRKRGG
jgi:ubiquinone/menaquinone biosynthesis C-methylase UbiE